MPQYTINLIDRDAATTTAGGGFYATSNGSHMLGESVTFTRNMPGTVDLSDEDTFFDDSDPTQVLVSTETVGPQTYAAGTNFVNEYRMRLEAPDSSQFDVLVVTLDDAATVVGFTFVGVRPPIGTALTVTAVDGAEKDVRPASSVAPVCFVEGTLIETPDGPRPVERLVPEDLVNTLDNGPRPVRLVIRRTQIFRPNAHRKKPIELKPGALGPGLPARPLRISPQHRILLRAPSGQSRLVAAHALAGAPRPGSAAAPSQQATSTSSWTTMRSSSPKASAPRRSGPAQRRWRPCRARRARSWNC